MTRSVPNPVRATILWIGLALSRVGLIDRERARRTADLAWPRIVTGLARMSKNAVDVAMVGIAVGSAAIAGVGFASPFWGLAFSVGSGIATGTIALVSQRYGADAHDQLGQAIRSSVLLVVILTLPLTALFWTFPTELLSLLTDDPEAIDHGATYLRIVGLGVPFAGVNLVGSRTFVGLDDAWTPMVIRAGGAVVNVFLNATLIFGLDLGVAGAATGTVLANVAVAATFAVTLVTGRLPGVATFDVSVDPAAPYRDRDTVRALLEIGTPVLLTNLVWRVAEFPMLAIVDLFGRDVVAAYVITRRIWDLMNTPGWGFNLASSSLVGQELGAGDEGTAEAYGREIIRFGFAVYFLTAAIVFVFAEPIVVAFVGDAGDPSVPIAVGLVYAGCGAISLRAISRGAAGPLKASGDTKWPFYSQVLGMVGCAIPLAYLGATTQLGLWGLYLAFFAETGVPAAINYYRFSTGAWKEISRRYRPDTPAGGD